jgi:iron complex transport system substrate-binding protein
MAGHARIGHTGRVRILSLLPSATEIVYLLGLQDELVGVTHECDWPDEARSKRAVTRSALPAGATPAEVDRMVSESIAGGAPIYRLDEEAVMELQPDLILSQDLCAVCAVPSGQVEQALGTLGCAGRVISLDPSSLDEVLDCVLRVGEATGRTARAQTAVSDLRDRLAGVEKAVAGRTRPRTFALEWSDPPFNGGHWIPGMIDLAGGEPVLGSYRAPSVRIEWETIAAALPEVVVFMPCGYDLESARREASDVASRPELSSARAVFAVDASSYFSRPGPRLVDGVELLAAALHPGTVTPRASGGISRIR